MATTRIGLSNLQLEIDDNHIAYTPDSLSFINGKGEYNVRSMAAGGGAVEIVVTENVATKISDVKFSSDTTDYIVEVSRGWKELRSLHAIRIFDPDGEFSAVFIGMTLVPDPEYKVSQDGTVDFEFKGNPSY